MQPAKHRSAPFLLHFASDVEPMLAPRFSYDPTTQCDRNFGLFCGTQRGRSYQNSTTCYSIATRYEDYDDEYVVVAD